MLLASPMPPAAITGTFTAVYDLLHQGEGADLRGDVSLEEHAAMAAGLRPLRDNRIDTALGENQRFAARGGRADDFASGPLHPLNQLRRGQAEMEAHHLGPQILHHAASRFGEAVDRCLERRFGQLDAKLSVIGRKPLEPRRLAREVALRLVMAEEIEIDRLRRARPDRGHAFAHFVVAQPGARQRPEAAGFGHGNRHVDAARIGHRRLDDRQRDAEQIDQPLVGPTHRSQLLPSRLPSSRKRSALSLMKPAASFWS